MKIKLSALQALPKPFVVKKPKEFNTLYIATNEHIVSVCQSSLHCHEAVFEALNSELIIEACEPTTSDMIH